jgi:hypothetical protein
LWRKMIFFHVRIKKTEVEYLQKWRTQYVFSIFEDIQLQFSLSWHEKKSFFVTNLFKINIFSFSSITRLKRDPTLYINDFLCDMTTELFIKYFCSIKLCCLWRFDEKLFVFKYCFIFIVLDDIPHVSLKEFNIWLS